MRSSSDFSLFCKKQGTSLTLILVYVDDILVTGDDTALVESVIAALHRKFYVKHLGNVSYFLGVEVQYNSGKGGFSLYQQKYIHELLGNTKMLDCKPCSTPMVPATKLSKVSGVPFDDPTLYMSTIGTLQYLTLTRPDIAFVVNKLIQFLSAPPDLHWTACKRFLRYLKGTATLQLHLCLHPRLKLSAIQTRIGLVVLLIVVQLGVTLSFLGLKSKIQYVVSRSCAESEYRSLAIKKFLFFTSSAIALAGNPVFQFTWLTKNFSSLLHLSNSIISVDEKERNLVSKSYPRMKTKSGWRTKKQQTVFQVLPKYSMKALEIKQV